MMLKAILILAVGAALLMLALIVTAAEDDGDG